MMVRLKANLHALALTRMTFIAIQNAVAGSSLENTGVSVRKNLLFPLGSAIFGASCSKSAVLISRRLGF